MRRLLLVMALLASAARAQIAPPDTTHWRFRVTPYAWLSSLDGRVGIGPVSTNVDLSVHDLLKMLKFAAMATGEARFGHWVAVGDGVYASTGAGRAVAFRGDTGTFGLTQRETILQPTGGYTIGDDTWAVDFLGGFRYWNLNAVLDVDRTRRPTTTRRAATRQWVDATGGARLRWEPVPIVHVVAAGDGGGGGARNTWQAYGSVGVDAWSKVSVAGAYRALSVDYDRQNFLFDTDTKGFILGVTFHF